MTIATLRPILSLIACYRLLLGANGSSASIPTPPNKRRDLMLIAGLVDHPEMGLILFETGSAEDVKRVCQIPLICSEFTKVVSRFSNGVQM